jgi:hypothetical protein
MLRIHPHADIVAPHEFEMISFPVKAIKLLLHDIRIGGDAAAITTGNREVDSDDGVGLFDACVSLLTANHLFDRTRNGQTPMKGAKSLFKA